MKASLRSHIISYAVFLGKGSQTSRKRIIAFSIKGKALFSLLHWKQGLLTILNNWKWVSTPRSSSLFKSWMPALCLLWLMAGCTISWVHLNGSLLSELFHLLCFSICQLHSVIERYPAFPYYCFLRAFHIHHDSLQPRWAVFLTGQNYLPYTNYWFC